MSKTMRKLEGLSADIKVLTRNELIKTTMGGNGDDVRTDPTRPESSPSEVSCCVKLPGDPINVDDPPQDPRKSG